MTYTKAIPSWHQELTAEELDGINKVEEMARQLARSGQPFPSGRNLVIDFTDRTVRYPVNGSSIYAEQFRKTYWKTRGE